MTSIEGSILYLYSFRIFLILLQNIIVATYVHIKQDCKYWNVGILDII